MALPGRSGYLIDIKVPHILDEIVGVKLPNNDVRNDVRLFILFSSSWSIMLLNNPLGRGSWIPDVSRD